MLDSADYDCLKGQQPASEAVIVPFGSHALVVIGFQQSINQKPFLTKPSMSPMFGDYKDMQDSKIIQK